MSARALDARTVEVSFAIADGYYMYRERFRFAVGPGIEGEAGRAAVSAGHAQEGRVLRRGGDLPQAGARSGCPWRTRRARCSSTVTSQGCADVGVCYVPMDSKATIQLAAFSAPPRRARRRRRARILAAGERLRDRAPVRVGRPAAGAGELPRLRPAARVHALRAADDPDPVGHHRRRGPRPRQAARAAAVARLRARHGGRLCRGRRGRRLVRHAARRGAAERLGAGRVRAGLRRAGAVDVRLLRAAAARLPAPPSARRRTAACGAAASPRSPRWACCRRSSSAPASRRRSPARCSTSARRGTSCSAARRCSRWRSAWACRCWWSACRKARCCPGPGPGWCA